METGAIVPKSIIKTEFIIKCSLILKLIFIVFKFVVDMYKNIIQINQ
jgi:hypothetical protein